MPQTRAVITTLHAERTLRRLCKHWAHRFEIECGGTEARIALPLGEARLRAGPDALTVEVTAEEAALPELRDVVARHVERFAVRETLRIDWA